MSGGREIRRFLFRPYLRAQGTSTTTMFSCTRVRARLLCPLPTRLPAHPPTRITSSPLKRPVSVPCPPVSGLLDFEFSARDWRAMELAICLSKCAPSLSSPFLSLVLSPWRHPAWRFVLRSKISSVVSRERCFPGTRSDHGLFSVFSGNPRGPQVRRGEGPDAVLRPGTRRAELLQLPGHRGRAAAL